jgi:hypothetical protein
VSRPQPTLSGRAEEGPAPRAGPLPGGSSAPIVRVVPQQAGVAQSVERLICNQQVKGSSPLASSENRDVERRESRAGRGSDRVRHAIGSGRAIRGQEFQQSRGHGAHRGDDGHPGGGAAYTFSGLINGSLGTRPRASRGKDAERYRSGQTGQTVNLLAFAFGGSNPPLSTTGSTRVKTDGRSTRGRE